MLRKSIFARKNRLMIVCDLAQKNGHKGRRLDFVVLVDFTCKGVAVSHVVSSKIQKNNEKGLKTEFEGRNWHSGVWSQFSRFQELPTPLRQMWWQKDENWVTFVICNDISFRKQFLYHRCPPLIFPQFPFFPPPPTNTRTNYLIFALKFFPKFLQNFVAISERFSPKFLYLFVVLTKFSQFFFQTFSKFPQNFRIFFFFRKKGAIS